MVRAILEGRKTQTRRVVKPVGKDEGFVICEQDDGSMWPHRSSDGERCWHTVIRNGHEYQDDTPHTGYGRVGDRLWVKETWNIEALGGGQDGAGNGSWSYEVGYRAGGEKQLEYEGHFESDPYCKSYDTQRGEWRPSIHMPRWASRITLEITGVRVERLQDISDDDCKAEGLIGKDFGGRLGYGYGLPDWSAGYLPRIAYRQLWESINGAESWAANPFVWVISFKRVKP
jgi:hypothetical protein